MHSPAPAAQHAAGGSYAEVLHVALPLIVSMGSFTVMQFCDRVFLAQYSAVSIQAALPAGILAFTLCCGFMELAAYATTFVAQFHGAGDQRGCSRAVAQAFLLSVAAWPVFLVLIPVGRALLSVSGHEPEVLKEELIYFTILMAGGITVPMGVAASTFFTGRGDTRTTMMANLVANAVNVVLDYVLIFGVWGFPELGIAGAAIATVIAGCVGPAILCAIFLSRRYDETYHTRENFRFDPALMRRIVRFGLPSSVHLFLDVTSFTVFILLTGRMGAASLAASNMAFSINMLAFMPLIALGITAGTLVGQYQGRGDALGAAKSGWITLRLGVAYTLVVGLSFVLLPRFYFSFFTSASPEALNMAEVFPLGRKMLWMMALWCCVDAANVILSGALKGAGDTRFVMIYSVVMAWCVFVTGEVVIVVWHDGTILQAWAWLTFHIMILATGYWWRFRSGRWAAIDLLGRRPPVSVPRANPEAVVVTD